MNGRKFFRLAQPLMEYLLEEGDPHTMIVITQTWATIKKDELHYPYNEENRHSKFKLGGAFDCKNVILPDVIKKSGVKIDATEIRTIVGNNEVIIKDEGVSIKAIPKCRY